MILVTGGTGLVGAHLLYKLTCENVKVKAIYRDETKLAKTKNIFALYTNNYEALFNTIEWVKADILDISELSDAFNDITKVYHCAAFVSFEPDKYHLLRKVNIIGTSNIVNLGISRGIEKLCYVSSIAALGESLQEKPITEDSIWNSEKDHNVYALTKFGAEMEVWRGTQEGLDAVIVNPGVILGAGIWSHGSGNLFKRAKDGLKFYPKGTVGLIDIDDVTEIMMRLMNSKITNERFLLVAENWSYKNFLKTLALSVNAKPPQKRASDFLLELLWRLDWLAHILIGKRRQLTKHLTVSLRSKRTYKNDKIIKALDHYTFNDIGKSIHTIGALYQKQV